VLPVELGHRRDGEVEVQHLRARAVRPGCRREPLDLLECQLGAVGAAQHQPVPALRVGLSRRRRLVTRAVPQAEQRTVELGQGAGVRTVEHGLTQHREAPLVGHGTHSHVQFVMAGSSSPCSRV
jgi:hypothetical protein